MYECDAKNEEPHDGYLKWKKPIPSLLVETLGLQKVYLSTEDLKSMTKQFSSKILPDHLEDWDTKDYEHLNLSFEIKKYLRA